MVQTLESIKGGGGSIKIGTTGKISALMSKELDSTKSASKIPSFGEAKPAVEAGSSTSSTTKTQAPETPKKTKHHTRKTQKIPILPSENLSIDGTPIRQKPVRGIVEVVDIRCGYPDKTWANPLTNKLKKLGFSKLSENNS